MKLSSHDQEIAACIEFSPETTAEELSKRIGLSPGRIAVRIRELRKEGVIRLRAFVNATALGYEDIAVFFAGRLSSGKERTEFELLLQKDDRVGWFGNLVGEYQYGTIIFCRNLRELGEFLSLIGDRFPDLFHDRIVSPRLRAHHFPRKYLSSAHGKKISFSLRAPGYDNISIDRRDAEILHRIAMPFESLRQASSELGIPFSTFERRISDLKRRGVIGFFFYDIAPEALDMQAYRLLMSCRGVSEPIRKKVFEFSLRHPNVVYLSEALGSWDFEVGIEAKGADTVVRITEELHQSCGIRLLETKLLNESKDIKHSFFPFAPSRFSGDL